MRDNLYIHIDGFLHVIHITSTMYQVNTLLRERNMILSALASAQLRGSIREINNHRFALDCLYLGLTRGRD